MKSLEQAEVNIRSKADNYEALAALLQVYQKDDDNENTSQTSGSDSEENKVNDRAGVCMGYDRKSEYLQSNTLA